MNKSVLAIGAHPDDIELGCYGTLCKLKLEGFKIYFMIVTNGEMGGDPALRKEEAQKSANFLGAEIIFGNFIDTQVSSDSKLIDFIISIIKKFDINMIFTHSLHDSHQDHRNVSNSVISASKYVPEIYFFETPSTSLKFYPTIHFDISETFEKKILALNFHISQKKRAYMANEAISGLADYRGFNINLIGKKVESFEVFKIVK